MMYYSDSSTPVGQNTPSFVSLVCFSEFARDCNPLIGESLEERKGYLFLIGQLERIVSTVVTIIVLGMKPWSSQMLDWCLPSLLYHQLSKHS